MKAIQEEESEGNGELWQLLGENDVEEMGASRGVVVGHTAIPASWGYTKETRQFPTQPFSLYRPAQVE